MKPTHSSQLSGQRMNFIKCFHPTSNLLAILGLSLWSASASAQQTLYYAPNSGGTSWNANWPTTNTNWSSSNTTFTGATPASGDDLIFSFTPSWGADVGKFLNTPAGNTRTMNSLTFNNNVRLIRQNGSQAQAALILGAGGLTLAATKTGPIAFGRGDNTATNFGSGNNYMPFFLTSSQTWTNNSAHQVEVRDGVAPATSTEGTTVFTIGGGAAADFFFYGGAEGREFTGAEAGGNNRLTGDKTVNPEGIRNFGSNVMELTVTGGTVNLEGIHSFSGSTTVSGGSLRLADANLTGGGAFTVASGATLGGTGTIAGASSISGTLAPGVTTGILSFNSSLTLGGTTHLDIGGVQRGTGYDAVDVLLSNGITFGGSLLLDFKELATAGDYNLFNFVGTPSGGFTNVALDGLYTGSLVENSGIWTGSSDGYTFTFSEATGALSVIPEPGTFAILASLGALGLIRRRVAARPTKP